MTMTETTRRDVIILVASAAAAAMLPAAPTVVAEPAPLAWIVGTPGEFDWRFVRAVTELEARKKWVEDCCGLDKCELNDEDPEECDCDYCRHLRESDADRKPHWDSINGTPTPADWIESGLGAICSRCGEETFGDGGAHGVGDDAVCEDCMTLADWDIVSPERAAEMRAEMAEDEDS